MNLFFIEDEAREAIEAFFKRGEFVSLKMIDGCVDCVCVGVCDFDDFIVLGFDFMVYVLFGCVFRGFE